MYQSSINGFNKYTEQKIHVYPTETSTQSLGRLRVRITARQIEPVANATVTVTQASTPDTVLDQVKTDASGLTETIELPAPPVDYSLTPSTQQPYAEYTINVSSPEFVPVTIQNAQILPKVTALQEATLVTQSPLGAELFVIPPHTLFGDFPPKIAESEIKETKPSGEIVLPNVVIPEYVVVHDGPPTDTSAANHYIRFRDYIKNVASSEIYATWPESTITANVLAILSFTLNRVYTEWYRNQGHNFTITSSTAFDHKWVPGRNVFDSISLIVDQMFTNYLSRPNVKQPILTQYCDGVKVQCPNWMTQWGSKDLGEQGKSAIEILRHFYGNTIYINSAKEVSGVPVSWPGSNLSTGSSGPNVRMIQEQLNKISDTYGAISKLAVNGQFNQQTADAVKTFQKTFDLPATGIVDLATWYKISNVYVNVARLAQ
ncbi:MAG TPA: peptidoglycan-binding protein [Mobilitalea sp.]|nr:peptidoglycan-binding protein [Mobilitalea sp.]